MEKNGDYLKDLIIRYSILLLFGVLNSVVFYFLFTALTLYPVYFLLNLIFESTLIGNIILVQESSIEIIGSCVAASAYYLLLILNLSMPKIEIKKRIKLLLFTFISLLIANILRIFLLSLLLVSGNSWFDLTHRLFWYLGSTLLVVLIWFWGVKKFQIKEIPFYSDIKFLLANSVNKSSNKKKKSKQKKHKKISLRKNAKKPKSSKKH